MKIKLLKKLRKESRRRIKLELYGSSSSKLNSRSSLNWRMFWYHQNGNTKYTKNYYETFDSMKVILEKERREFIICEVRKLRNIRNNKLIRKL